LCIQNVNKKGELSFSRLGSSRIGTLGGAQTQGGLITVWRAAALWIMRWPKNRFVTISLAAVCVCLIIALHNLSLFLHGTCLRRAYYVKANWLSEQIIAAALAGQTAWLSRATSTCSLADDFYAQNECCATPRVKRDN
jgi:hypothetical protein